MHSLVRGSLSRDSVAEVRVAIVGGEHDHRILRLTRVPKRNHQAPYEVALPLSLSTKSLAVLRLDLRDPHRV